MSFKISLIFSDVVADAQRTGQIKWKNQNEFIIKWFRVTLKNK
jgi:hypothetical protein